METAAITPCSRVTNLAAQTEAETDIVDYSRITIDDPTLQGIELDLGNSASQQVEVSYLEGAAKGVVDSDQIHGFEGVVGSAGADDIQGSNTGNYLAGGAGDDTLSGFSGGAVMCSTIRPTYNR